MITKLVPLTIEAAEVSKYKFNQGAPKWLNKYDDKTSWYTDGNPVGVEDSISFWVNCEDISETEKKFYVQYGKNEPGWAGCIFFAQHVKIIDETANPDNTLNVIVDVKPLFFKKRETDHSYSGVSVKYNVSINGQNVFSYSGNTTNSFDKDYTDVAIKVSTKIAPEQVKSNTAFIVKINYPNGEFDNTSITVGAGVKNPKPKMYIPMSIRKVNDFKSLDKNNGFIKIRLKGKWSDRGGEYYNTIKVANKGHNRIREGGKWIQLPPM